MITRIAALGLKSEATSSMTAQKAQSCIVDGSLAYDPEDKAFNAWILGALAITTVAVLLLVLIA